MKIFIWLLRIALFILLLGFAAKNSGSVSVRFFFDADWQLPLVAVMLLFFAAGAAVGVTAALGSYLRQRREILKLKRETERASSGAGRT